MSPTPPAPSTPSSRWPCRDTAHFTELLQQRLQHIDGVLATESFFVLRIHKMAYGWGVAEVATAVSDGPA